MRKLKNLTQLRRAYDKFLEVIAVIMMAAVTVIVTLGFTYRWLGFSLVWYDEIASISLCWLTYYASALAALRGSHIGFSGFVNSLPARWRVAATLTASGINIFFFAMLAWMGLAVVQILKGDTLVSIPWLSLQVTQSVIPIAASMFVIAELARIPELVREARRGPLEDPELKIALEHAAQTGKEIKR